MGVAACLLLSQAAAQQGLRLSPQVELSLSTTSNGNYGSDAPARSDTLLTSRASLRADWRSARFTLEGRVGVEGLAYARREGASKLLPSADLALKSTLVERWLFLDAEGRATQTAVNAFGGSLDNGAATNRQTTLYGRLSPYLSRELTPTLSLLARLDRAWTRREGSALQNDTRRSALDAEELVRIEQKPVPLGWALEFRHDATDYADSADAVLDSRAWRARVDYAPVPDFDAGLVLGREHARYAAADRDDTIVGLRLRYSPSERSSLHATIERRYFGTGIDLELRHRSPFLSLFARLVRRPSALPSAQTLTGSGSTASLLDAMLTTREPDPLQRAIKVRELMSTLNLPEQLSGPVDVLVDSARLEEGLDIGGSLQGRLTTVGFSAYVRRLQALPDGSGLPLPTDNQSSRQSGLSVFASRRLNPMLSAEWKAGFSRVDGLSALAGQRTEERSMSGSLSWLLSPKTTVTASIGRQLIRSNVAGVGSDGATVAALAIGHRF